MSSLIQFPQFESGTLSAIQYFKTIETVIGNGLPNKEVTYTKGGKKTPITIGDPPVPLTVKIDKENVSIKMLVWPWSLYSFNYQYKKFLPESEAKIAEANGATILWKSTPQKGEFNSGGIFCLVEHKERKTSLNLFERDDIALEFISKDGVRGVARGYIKYMIIDFALATSAIHAPKKDAEKAVADLYREWAGDEDFMESIKKATVENILSKKSNFLENLNEDIYKTGFVVQEFYIESFFIYPSSQDIIDKYEEIKKKEIDQQVKQVEQATAKVEAATLDIQNDAKAAGIKKIGEANNTLTLDLQQKQNALEVTKADQLGMVNNKVEEDLKKRLAVVGNNQLKKETEIKLEAAGKVIEKMILYKQMEDVTEIKVAQHHGNVKGVLVINGGSNSKLSNFDDDLVSQTVANFITKKKGGTDESK